MNARTQRLLHGPVVATVLALAWPTVLVQVAQAATGLIETFWVAKLGTDALAGMALVFPAVMLMQMVSGVRDGRRHILGDRARAGRRQSATRQTASCCTRSWPTLRSAPSLRCSPLVFGPALYHALAGAGHDASLAAALKYSNVVFAGSLLIWLVNALASVLRGTGNMFVALGRDLRRRSFCWCRSRRV